MRTSAPEGTRRDELAIVDPNKEFTARSELRRPDVSKVIIPRDIALVGTDLHHGNHVKARTAPWS